MFLLCFDVCLIFFLDVLGCFFVPVYVMFLAYFWSTCGFDWLCFFCRRGSLIFDLSFVFVSRFWSFEFWRWFVFSTILCVCVCFWLPVFVDCVFCGFGMLRWTIWRVLLALAAPSKKAASFIIFHFPRAWHGQVCSVWNWSQKIQKIKSQKGKSSAVGCGIASAPCGVEIAKLTCGIPCQLCFTELCCELLKTPMPRSVLHAAAPTQVYPNRSFRHSD